MASPTVKKVNWWHQRLADWMLVNPGANIRDAAKIFNCTETTLYIVKNSDAFKAYWEFRRRKLEDGLEGDANAALGLGLMEKTAAIAEMAMDQILEQLESNGKAQSVGAPIIPHDELRSTADMAMKKLGYGLPSKSGDSPVQNNQINLTIDANLLAQAREKMKQIHGVETAAPALPAPVGDGEGGQGHEVA